MFAVPEEYEMTFEVGDEVHAIAPDGTRYQGEVVSTDLFDCDGERAEMYEVEGEGICEWACLHQVKAQRTNLYGYAQPSSRTAMHLFTLGQKRSACGSQEFHPAMRLNPHPSENQRLKIGLCSRCRRREQTRSNPWS